MDLADGVVIVHPLLAPISDEDVASALLPSTAQPTTHTLRLAGSPLRLAELADLDWHRLLDGLARDDLALQPLLASTTGPVAYVGMAPIPLALELGRRLGPTRPVFAFQRRHDRPSWQWPSRAATVSVQLHGAPTSSSRAKGDVTLRVGCSHPVLIDDVRRVVPFPLGELSIEVDGPHEDVLQSEADLVAVATKFGEALDAVARCFPNCDTIHLFAAVPCGLAIRMGTEITPNVHSIPIQTYQYPSSRVPRYARAIVLGQRARPAPTDEQRQAADDARLAFARSLVAIRPLADLELDDDMWPVQLLGGAGHVLPAPLTRLGPLGRNRTVADSQIGPERDAKGEFRWDGEARTWVLDDRLLAALAARLAPRDIETAGRLFFLHEAIHIAKQGITTATAVRLGRLPRVLEEVDYLADVWALVNDYGRAARAGDVDEARAPLYMRELLRVMTSTLWAFDADHVPLRSIPIRRLNRYLIWSWLRIAIEAADDLPTVLAHLATKPVLEISGPRVRIEDNRVVFDLDPAGFDDVELGVLCGGNRIVRVGTRAGAEVRGLLDALRVGDETGFFAGLRGVYDSALA